MDGVFYTSLTKGRTPIKKKDLLHNLMDLYLTKHVLKGDPDTERGQLGQSVGEPFNRGTCHLPT